MNIVSAVLLILLILSLVRNFQIYGNTRQAVKLNENILDHNKELVSMNRQLLNRNEKLLETLREYQK